MSLITEQRHWWRKQSLQSKIWSSLLTCIFLVPIVGGIIGMLLSNIVPSKAGIHFGFYCGSAVGLTYALLVVRKIRRRPSTRIPTIYGAQKLTPDAPLSWPMVPFMLIIGFMFGYTAFAWGYPWLYNMAFAPVVSKEVSVTGWESATRGSCRRPEIGYSTFVIAPHALCADLDARSLMQPGTLIRLVGPESIFGMNVQKIYALEIQR